MDSKKEMKQLRNEIRHFMDLCNKDWTETKYMNPLVNRIRVEFVKWNKKDHHVLVRVRDAQKDIDWYNNNFVKYEWIYTGSRFRFSKIWEMVNNVAISIRNAEKF